MDVDEPITEEVPDKRLPWQQYVFDDIFLLVMGGLVVPTIFYIVWGLWVISNVAIFSR